MADTVAIMERLHGALEPIEETRLALLEKQKQAWTTVTGVGGGALVLAVTMIAVIGPFAIAIGILGFIACGFVYHCMTKGPKKAFHSGFKNGVVSEVIRELQPDMRYKPYEGISEDLFRSSQLYRTRPDRYQTEDLMVGRIGATDVMIAEIHAEDKRTRTNSKGQTQTHYVDIFKGIFMIADFHKEFHGVTRVLPDKEDGLFGSIGKSMKGFLNFDRKSLVRMEDPDFENHFAVFSSDHVEAHYILSTSLMRRILDLREAWENAKIRLSFVESMVHLAIPFTENLLEPNAKRSVHDREQMAQIIQELQSCFQIVEDLNLNTRIWSKT